MFGGMLSFGVKGSDSAVGRVEAGEQSGGRTSEMQKTLPLQVHQQLTQKEQVEDASGSSSSVQVTGTEREREVI